MKRVVKSQIDINNDYRADLRAAKDFVDKAKQSMTYLQATGEGPRFVENCSKFVSQLSTMSYWLEYELDVREQLFEDIDSSSKILSADDDLPKGYYDEYYGQTAYEEWGDLVSKQLKGKIISKRADDGEEPGGLIYEAENLGIEDFYELLQCLEGLCYNGEAVEISDYQYKIL